LQLRADYVVITCNRWENICKQREIGITAHFIDKELNELSLVLVTVEELPGEHSSTTLVAFIDKKLSEFLPPNSTIIACITDGVSNFRLAAKHLIDPEANNNDASPDTWHCVAHRMQLCLSDVFSEKDSSAALDLDCVHSVVSMIYRSVILREEFSKIQHLEGFERLELILPVPTHFDSQLAMLECFLKFLLVIQIMVNNGNLDVLSPKQKMNISTLGFQVWLQSYKEVLKLFHKVTEAMSDDQYVTLSSVP
jgi:hypothetical protein